MKILIMITIVFLNFGNAEILLLGSKECKLESISKSNVKKLFLLKKRSLNSERIEVVDSSDKAVYTEFVKAYLNKSVRKIKTYWTRMLFTGKKMPPKKYDVEGLKSLDNKGTCYLAYVNDQVNQPKEWKVINIK